MMQNLPAPFDLLPSSAIRNIELEQGEILFRQGDLTTGMFLLASGGVELRRVTEAGERLSIHHFSRGDTFAEASLFAERYHCEAVATASGQIVRFDKTALLDAFEQNPAFAFAIASRFAHQVQTYRRRLEILAIRGAERRVLNAVQEGLLETDIKSFAATIGLTHEATYRALAALVRQGRLVKPGRGSYRLPGNWGAA
jgi:CRP/FNR family transcriptional regulator, dissimilatory nitrate respiration regulator